MPDDPKEKAFDSLNGEAEAQRELEESTERLEKLQEIARKQTLAFKKNAKVFVRKLKKAKA